MKYSDMICHIVKRRIGNMKGFIECEHGFTMKLIRSRGDSLGSIQGEIELDDEFARYAMHIQNEFWLIQTQLKETLQRQERKKAYSKNERM